MFSVNFTLDNFEYYLLILVRIVGFVAVAPYFNSGRVPNTVKIGFSCLLAFMVYYTVPFYEPAYTSIIGYSVCVIKETICGLLIGFGANLCQMILFLAGTIIDMDMGISMATEFDPSINMEVSITGSMYNYFVLILLMMSGMYQYIIRAIVDAYELIPVGQVYIQTDMLLVTMIKYMTDMIIIAFRIFLPIFASIMIINVILGIMAKVAPQMNMFAVGIQIKVIAGLTILFLTVFLIPDIANFIFREMKDMIYLMVEGFHE